MNTLPILIRREFWEHRVLWIAPLSLAVLYIITCFIPGALHIGSSGSLPGDATERAVVISLGIQLVFTFFLIVLMSVVVFFYLADCLYAERKDRSILFWKSLPVSDSITVLSKLLVALIVMPLAIWALALASNLIAFGILHLRFHDSRIVQTFIQWDTGSWLRLNAYLLMDVLVIALWYAPVAAYQLLISVWARSSVLVWTLLPPLALMLGERFLMGSWHVRDFLFYRLATGILQGSNRAFDSSPHDGIAAMIDRSNLLPVLGNVNLWIGVGVAAVLVFAAIRIRRYRDDT